METDSIAIFVLMLHPYCPSVKEEKAAIVWYCCVGVLFGVLGEASSSK